MFMKSFGQWMESKLSKKDQEKIRRQVKEKSSFEDKGVLLGKHMVHKTKKDYNRQEFKRIDKIKD